MAGDRAGGGTEMISPTVGVTGFAFALPVVL